MIISSGSFRLKETDSESDSKNQWLHCTVQNISQTQTQILTPYLCVGQESESESVPKSVSGNVNEP